MWTRVAAQEGVGERGHVELRGACAERVGARADIAAESSAVSGVGLGAVTGAELGAATSATVVTVSEYPVAPISATASVMSPSSLVPSTPPSLNPTAEKLGFRSTRAEFACAGDRRESGRG